MILNSIANIANNQKNYNPKFKTMSKVNVYSEFGKLKEIVVGRPLDKEDLILEWEKGMDEEFSWMKKETFDAVKANAGKPWSEVEPELFEKINTQIRNFQDKLREHGVIVHEVPKLEHGDRNYLNKGIEQLFPRDVWCTAGNTVICSSLRMPHKRKQYITMNPFYTKLMAEGEITYLQAPQASTDVLSPRKEKANKENILLDGGDFVVNGKEIYLGQGHGSNALGAKFAQSILGDEFKVIPVKLSDSALHLDCTIALIKPGLGIICWEFLADKSELPETLRDWTWIEATKEEADWLAVNGISIGDNTYFADPSNPRIVEELRKHDVNVVEIPYDGLTTLGGSLRCSSQPIYREDV